ncbi:MAG: DUF2723 domain-containing protein, partial [Anaerolineales bacterium]
MAPRRLGLAGAGAALVLLVVYLATMAPSLSWAHDGADGGDLATAVASGGIPHPPGFPAYLLLGSLFVRLPWGDVAWRLNLMSAVLAAGAAGLVAIAAGKVMASVDDSLPPGGRSPALRNSISAFCTGLCLGLAPLVWSQALIAEVYSAAAFFAALVVLLALLRGPAWALGLALGLGAGAHPTLVFLAPVVVWAVWVGTGRERATRLVGALTMT